MDLFLKIIAAMAVMVSAMMLGIWLLVEVERTRMREKPFYKVFLTPPGILVVLLAIGLPILFWRLKNP